MILNYKYNECIYINCIIKPTVNSHSRNHLVYYRDQRFQSDGTVQGINSEVETGKILAENSKSIDSFDETPFS